MCVQLTLCDAILRTRSFRSSFVSFVFPLWSCVSNQRIQVDRFGVNTKRTKGSTKGTKKSMADTLWLPYLLKTCCMWSAADGLGRYLFCHGRNRYTLTTVQEIF